MDVNQKQLRFDPIQQCLINPLTKAFPIDLTLDLNRNTIFLGQSDYSITYFNMETLSSIWSVPGVHKNKINGVCQVQNRLLATCSGDATIKLFDHQSGQMVSQLRNIDTTDFYSIDSSEYIIAAGSEGLIRFYDIRTMKLRSTFEESQNDEVSSVHFNQWIPTELLSCSLDGILVVYDLTQTNEEESLNNMIRFEEALEYSNYFDKDICFSISTTHKLSIIDNNKGEKINETKLIDHHNEFNQNYLVGVTPYQGKLNYFIGDKEKFDLIKQYDLNQKEINHLTTNQTDQIRHIKYLDKHHSFLLFGEDGSLEVLQAKEELQKSMEQEMQDEFQDENPQKKKQQKLTK